MIIFELPNTGHIQVTIQNLKKIFDQGEAIAVIQTSLTSANEIIELQNMIANELGELLPQNSEGEKNVLVYSRSPAHSVLKGARFHQTQEAGYFHTDNANTPFKWDYVILACLSTAKSGGESILVDGKKVYEHLKNNQPNTLKKLEMNYFWEERGLSNDIFPAPIISYDELGIPEFRYLRPYMESAHRRAKKPLDSAQIEALNDLEKLFSNPENQYRQKLRTGEILITKDSLVPHSRTAFTDYETAISYSELSAKSHEPLKRTLNRIWVKRS